MQEVDLVLHQRDERRDDQRDAVEHERGELVAQALARAGGEDRQDGAAGEQAVDDGLLAFAEGVEAEDALRGFGPGRSPSQRHHRTPPWQPRHRAVGAVKNPVGVGETYGVRREETIVKFYTSSADSRFAEYRSVRRVCSSAERCGLQNRLGPPLDIVPLASGLLFIVMKSPSSSRLLTPAIANSCFASG